MNHTTPDHWQQAQMSCVSSYIAVLIAARISAMAHSVSPGVITYGGMK